MDIHTSSLPWHSQLFKIFGRWKFFCVHGREFGPEGLIVPTTLFLLLITKQRKYYDWHYHVTLIYNFCFKSVSYLYTGCLWLWSANKIYVNIFLSIRLCHDIAILLSSISSYHWWCDLRHSNFFVLGQRITWSYWASGQPSKTFGLWSYEDCGQMRRGDGWRWHDKNCDSPFSTYRFICQFGKVFF